MSWPRVRLEEVANINPRLPKGVDESQQVTFVAMASASEDGRLIASEPRVLSETKKGFTYFNKNDVLLAKITPCFENGKCLRPGKIPTEMGFGSTEFHVIRPDEDKLDGLYLFYLVWSEQFRFLGQKSMSGAAGQKRVGADFLKGFEIPLPPLPEQKRIAAILDKADAIRRKRQQAIQLADDFLRAVFLDMFGDPVTNPKGWPCKPLGGISLFENGDRSSNYPSGDDLVSDGVLFLSTKNIVSNALSLEHCQYITEEKFASLSRGKAQKGDLIITLRGTLGSCCVFDCEHGQAFINAQMMIVRAGSEVSNLFLHALLVSDSIRNHFQRIGQGAAVPQLTSKQLKELLLPIPPIQEQVKYENIRNSVLANIAKMQAACEVNLFASISLKAFSGQL